MTWRIRHAGEGWIASDGAGRGAYFPKWDDAVAFVDRRIRDERRQQLEEFDVAFRRGLIKLTSRGVHAIGFPGRGDINDTEVRIAEAMRTNGHAWAEIGDVLDRHPRAIKSAVWRSNHPTSNLLED